MRIRDEDLVAIKFVFNFKVFRTTGETTVLHPIGAPTAVQLQIPLNQTIKRVMKLLTRRDNLVEEQGMTCMAGTDMDAAMAPLQSAAYT